MGRRGTYHHDAVLLLQHRRFGHPEQDRAISVREGSAAPDIPNRLEFSDKSQPPVVRDAARHIGNAVPVKLAEAIGVSIVEAVDA